MRYATRVGPISQETCRDTSLLGYTALCARYVLGTRDVRPHVFGACEHTRTVLRFDVCLLGDSVIIPLPGSSRLDIGYRVCLGVLA